MTMMYNPPHPGETLREDVLPALELSVAEAARQLGVSRVALSRVLHGHAAISVDLARRLELWLGGQLAYDLWQASKTPAPRVCTSGTCLGTLTLPHRNASR